MQRVNSPTLPEENIPDRPTHPPRSLGAIGERGGPTLLCIGGLHGNEPSGVLGLQRVLLELDLDSTGLVGRIAAFVGNRPTLAIRERFIDADLNRLWTAERLERVRAAGTSLAADEQEMLELADELEAELADAPRAKIIDLHSTSAGGPAFVNLDDSLANRAMARAIPVPHVLGLEEEIAGTLVGFFNARGVTGIGFEAGQHDVDESVDRAEAAIWLLMEVTGVLERGARPEVAAARQMLEESSRVSSGLVEVLYRHGIMDDDEFMMRGGYAGFEAVRRGEVLAQDVRGPVTAPCTGQILMPLYQARGSDGFFLVRRVHPVWLTLSGVIRRTPAERLLHWLPGVERHKEEAGVFMIDLRRARWLARQIFHLLGYRRRSVDHRVMEMVRRETAW